MDEDEDYDSDSTVLITDFSKNPEKIARKRRKLDATIRRVSQTNINAASDAENRAPNVTSTAPRDGKRGRYNDADAEQWRINKFLSKLDPVSNINENYNVSEDLKVRKELLKQKYSDPRISEYQGNDDKEVREDCVIISDDSDDDCTVVNNKLCNQVDKNTNLNSRISVLTPSAINTRRATLDSFESNKTASNNDPVNSTNPNKVNPKLTVLKPSAINARRATINCFEINDGTSKNVLKSGVDFSSNENKNKESHDDKINENVTKQVTETSRLSGQKRTSERPPKPTAPDQNETPRRRNSSDVVQGKPCDLQIRRIISSSKNINENSGVNTIVNQNQSISSSNVIHSTAEVLASIQKTSGIQEKSNISKVNNTDSNQSNLGHDITMKINTDNDVCEDINDINKINGINSRNSEVNNSKDTTNHMNCQTVNSNKRPVDINVFKNGNENSSVPKFTDANHVTVDRNTLNSNTFTNTVVLNTNSLENSILQNLRNMNGKIVQQKKDSGVLNDSNKANEKLSKINKSNDAQRVVTDIQTDDNDALCSNVVTELTNANSSANPVIENLKNIVQRTEIKGKNKSDEKRNEVNNEQSPHIINCGQEINFNKISETGNRKRNCDIRPNKRGSEFHVGFFKDVKQYLKEIFREGKNLNSMRASPNVLKREIKHIIYGAKKHDVSEMQYACPKCSQVSVYSPKAMHQIGNDDNPIVENNTSKCKLCLGLQILHTTNVEVYSELKINKNYDEINTTHQRRQNDVSNPPSGENNRNNASKSALNMTATQNHTLSREVVTSFPEVSSKPGENQNKKRTSIETSGQSDPEVYKNNDTATSGDKAKSHKRKVDDKRSPANPKRVRTNTNTQDKNTKATKKNKNQTELSSTTAVPSSTSEPSTFYNSTSRISNGNDNAKTYYDTNEGGSTINDTSDNGDKSYTNKDQTNSKALCTEVLDQYFTKLKKSRITTDVIQALEKFIQTTENYDTKTENRQHVCSVCSCVFSSPASLSAHMKENHNWDNIPDKGNVIKCPLCNVHLTETNYIAHVKVHYPEKNSEHVSSDDITSINNNQDVSGANTEHQNKANIVTSSGRKKYECAICKKVLYSSFMAKKHRNEVHGHLDLKYKKLYNVTERKGRLERASTDIQSSTSVRNITSEDPTLGNEEEITNQDSERMNEMNRREENDQMKTNEVTAHRKDDAKKSNNYVKNSNRCTDQMSVPKNCHDNHNENTKTNQKRKRKASHNSNLIQEVKQAYVKKCKEKTMHKCLICKEIFTDYGSRKHREDKHPEFINRHLFDTLTITDVREINEGKTSDGETSVKSKTQKDDQYEINLINAFLGELEDEEKSRRSIDDVQDINKTDTVTKPPKSSEDIENNGNAEQTRSPRVNDILQTNADIISECVTLHETNAQKSSADADESSSQADEHEAMKVGETNDVNMDDTDDPNTKNNSEDSSSKKIGVNETNKSPDISTEENVDGKLNSGDEDTINTEEKKPRIFPASSKKKPSLANCYNCLTNLDVNDINNHECLKAERTLYNCFSCGVNIHRDETHECENENNSCIENIQITKVETVPEVNVFKCEDCNTATDIYDDVIRHCQNHYNNIKDTTAFCPTCQLNYNTSYFETHKHLHENEMKITNYSYKSLFSNWNTVFDNIPTDIVKEMQLRSIYRSHSVRMRVTEEGPWQHSLYQCNQCETCVPPAKLDHHCQKQCCFVAYPCPACERLFPSAEICATHELDHITTKQFKIIEFNCKKDERFNHKLFEARKLEMVSRIPIADIYKCQCGVCFVSNEVFRKHFASCNMESDKGKICSRCAVPRLFEATELENHLRVHHDSTAYRFRVNQLVIQQEVEPFDFFNQENGGESECRPSPNVSRAENDIKRELLKQENEDFTV